MNPAEIRIVAHVCGDGWLTSYLERNSLQIVNGRRYRRNRIRYQIGYCNTDETLLRQFRDDVISVFGIKPIRVRSELRLKSKRVFDRIKSLGGGASREWSIVPEIITSRKEVKVEWLKAFFDDEATVEVKTGRIRVKSMNENGLKQVKILLNDLEINSTITGPNIDKSWYLSIGRKYSVRFRDVVGFYHPVKIEKLLRIKEP